MLLMEWIVQLLIIIGMDARTAEDCIIYGCLDVPSHVGVPLEDTYEVEELPGQDHHDTTSEPGTVDDGDTSEQVKCVKETTRTCATSLCVMKCTFEQCEVKVKVCQNGVCTWVVHRWRQLTNDCIQNPGLVW